MSRTKLLTPTEFLTRATAAIDASKTRISLVSLIVTDDHTTEDLINALARAAKRGVHVTMAGDIFTFGEFGGHLAPLKYFAEQSKATRMMVKKLTKAGVKFTWVGRYSLSPLTGRNHMKCIIADDTVFSFGGVNLDSGSMSHADFMFETVDSELAYELHEIIARTIEADKKHFSYRSRSFTYNKLSTVLVDGGLQGDSIIYRRACDIVREATHVLFVSQYCPSGKIGKLLKQTETDLYFNDPSNTNNHLNSMFIRYNMRLSGFRTRYSREAYLHAKFIIATMPGGEKVAIAGSHNFAQLGVTLGTREIALETRDKKIIAQLESFFRQSVA